MNYWLAEPANLSECAQPLFDWTVAMIPGSREATRQGLRRKNPRLDDAHLRQHLRRQRLAMEPARLRLARPAFLGPLRVHRRQGLPRENRLARLHRGLGILARSPHGKGRQTRRPQRLVARARPARRRRGPRPANRLGPLHQHARSRQGPRQKRRARRKNRRRPRKTVRPAGRLVGTDHGMDHRAAGA